MRKVRVHNHTRLRYTIIQGLTIFSKNSKNLRFELNSQILICSTLLIVKVIEFENQEIHKYFLIYQMTTNIFHYYCVYIYTYILKSEILLVVLWSTRIFWFRRICRLYNHVVTVHPSNTKLLEIIWIKCNLAILLLGLFHLKTSGGWVVERPSFLGVPPR
jgi:hypothetical protein